MKKESVTESFTSRDTFELAKSLGEKAKQGGVYALYGDLGAGKTLFCQGFAEGLGFTGYVNSPTFTILSIYEGGRLPMYHFDVYRIEEPEEMEETGFDEYLSGGGVCLIEWAQLIEELLPRDTVRVTIDKDPEKGEDYRRITVSEYI